MKKKVVFAKPPDKYEEARPNGTGGGLACLPVGRGEAAAIAPRCAFPQNLVGSIKQLGLILPPPS
jgi:hypothetical protein